MESTVQQVGVRELLEAGVHFGHQARRWNPKMKKYVFAERTGIHIVDLDQTLTLLEQARQFVRDVAEAGRDILFVGTKKQAQFTVAEQALRCTQPYVVERYIGGMLTNFQTIYPRIQYFKTLATTVEETPEEERTGKEWFALYREYQKLRRNFAGITEMERLPGAVFVIDPKREELLVKEANRLGIAVVALTDTNCDPDMVDYVIPGNDDAIRAIHLISRLIADAVIEGRGEDEAALEDRVVPPAVEEALVAEEEATKSIPSAARDGGVSEDDTKGLAGADESAGDISPEEGPTRSYRGALDRKKRQPEQVSEETPGGPEPGQDMSERAQGISGEGDTRPEEVVWGEGTEEPETGEVTRDEATEDNESQEG